MIRCIRRHIIIINQGVLQWMKLYGKLRICIEFQKTKCNHKEGSIPITFHRWSDEHNSKVWGILFLRRIFKISSNLYSFRRQIQNYICYRLGGLLYGRCCLELKMDLQHIRELLSKHLENIWIVSWRYFWMTL